MSGIKKIMVEASRFQMAYALLRITLGVNMFFHGFMRIISNTGAWVDSQVGLFTDIADPSFLPTLWVTAFLWILPYFEIVFGTLLALGLYTYWMSVTGALMILVLIFGNTTRQAWGTVGNNMHYTIYFCILVAAHPYDWLSIDSWRSSKD
jgi:thiosulfate dehydrogenase [quinone] large subunit|tara:strand:+ start:1701 stop:2150 length:450 start_codon:yes stop_codon:yes gene_type:complete